MAHQDASGPTREGRWSVEETATFVLSNPHTSILFKNTLTHRLHLGNLHATWNLVYVSGLQNFYISCIAPDVVKGVGPMKDPDLACIVRAQFKPLSLWGNCRLLQSDRSISLVRFT